MVTPTPPTDHLFKIFDGVNEARLSLNRTKTVPHEYAAWFGKRCGYAISHYADYSFTEQYLAMRPTNAYVAPAVIFADYAPGGPLYGQIPKPTPEEYQKIHTELRRTWRSYIVLSLCKGLIPGAGLAVSLYGFGNANTFVGIAGIAVFLAFTFRLYRHPKRKNEHTGDAAPRRPA